MAPKRSPEALRALASDPVAGWVQTPLVKKTAADAEVLNAPYLAAFLKHHELPSSNAAMKDLSGVRLWDMTKRFLEAGSYQDSKIYPQGIEALAKAFNHGFEAPIDAQERLVTFLKTRSGEAFPAAARQLEQHYALCRRFRCPRAEMSDPPSYLDLFKNDEVPKSWSYEDGIERVLVSANGILRAWPALMRSGWDVSNASRDATSHWASCRADVDALHAEFANGQLSDDEQFRLSCFAVKADGILLLNFTACILFVNKLPGVLAARMQLRASYFDAFTDIGSAHAKAFLLAKLTRSALDPVAKQLCVEVDGPSAAEAVRRCPRLRELSSSIEARFVRPPKRPRLDRVADSALTLDEERLDWKKDLLVASHDVHGVKAQFRTILYVEIQRKNLPATTPVERWARAPPARLRALARSAVATYRSLFSRVFDATTQGLEEGGSLEEEEGASAGSAAAGSTAAGSAAEEGGDEVSSGSVEEEGQPSRPITREGSEEDDDDILKVSEVMRAAGVCSAVYLSFRSDLSNQMLTLKCAQTQGAFAERRPEVVHGRIPISVHKYRKSQDWPLAWKAVQNTQHLYQKRVRECLEEVYEAAGGHVPDLPAAELAHRVAASLRIQ